MQHNTVKNANTTMYWNKGAISRGALMFNNLSEKLTNTIKNLTGRGRLTEDNIKGTLRDIRTALLKADVALPIVKQFINDISEKALGQKILQSLKPGDTLVKIVHDELTQIKNW